MNKENIQLNTIDNDTTNIREEVEKYLLHWKWFLLGIILSLIGGYLYLRYTTPQYSATTTIMIKDNQKSGISKELETFKDLGIIGGSSSNNTDNEIEIIKSRKIIGRVVDSLDLYASYFVEGRVKKTELYRVNPIKISFISKNLIIKQKDTSFVVSILSDDKFELKDTNGLNSVTYNFDELIESNIGVIKINKTENFANNYSDIFVVMRKKESVISNYLGSIKITPVNKNSSVITISLNYPLKEKAEDFLNELVRQYNIDAINDKSEVSKKTKEFIDDRLIKIGEDLSKIQDDVKNYKNKNNITGLSKEGEMALVKASSNDEKIIELETELNLITWIKETLDNETKVNEILPQNLGFSDVAISKSIEIYNELVNKRNRLGISAGAKNPKLIQYKREIVSSKKNLKTSISNLIYSIESQLSKLKKEASKVSSKVSAIPILERGFIDIARQQEIISGLYSYLLKKKEETAISLAITVPNAKIIDVAYGSNVPVTPKKNIVYIASLLFGLIIPFIFIYLINLLDTKIHNKKDVEESLTVPFLGDIPKSETKEKIIVGNDVRSSGAEAFRLIKTNLDFMLAGNTKTSKFIFITSTTSGEGKSFISINLAATLAISGKRVLLMGMDLRAPKVTEYLGLESRKGVTNYITNKNLSLEDIKFNIDGVENLDIISSGAIPPNPAELLVSKSVENLFSEVKNYYYYDYVIVDTAPVNLVTDTLLISKYADMFLYVVRANYLDKRLLAIPEELYRDKRLPNMSIVLNDTDPKRSYGYGYGGYGYGYLAEQEKPWYKRIFSKS